MNFHPDRAYSRKLALGHDPQNPPPEADVDPTDDGRSFTTDFDGYVWVRLPGTKELCGPYDSDAEAEADTRIDRDADGNIL